MKTLLNRLTTCLMLAVLCGVGTLHAQGTIKGKVVDSESGEGLLSATVVLDGAGRGSFSDYEGDFKFKAPAGSYTLIARYVGYTEKMMDITITDGNTTDLGTIELVNNSIGLGDVEILASLARDRKTPVAVSSINAKVINERLSNQEFPELLRSTPSVYVTKQGGGFGDARINVRGFDQRNTAVLINGIPVNDMENGWVYWSNWAGLSDVTRTIQIQRGLGASKLAINSVGGTLNLITKTTDMEAGASARFSIGNDGYMKFGATASTGRMDNGFAVTLSASRTAGRGYIDATYIDAYSYFGSIAKDFGEKHQVVFTAFGAPQKHGQRSFRENLTQYVSRGDTNQAYEDIVTSSTVSDFDERQDGDGFQYSGEGNVRYNSDWGLNNGERFNIRENFYHKPQMALNHYWTINDDVSIKTSAYYSIGRGGGTGDRGSIGGRGSWGYRDDNGLIRVGDIMAWNTGTDSIQGFPADGHHQDAQNGYVASERSGLVKRASMNEHNWLGALSTANIALNEKMDLIAGVDLRRYKGKHYRRLNDLMGNNAWIESRDMNNQEVMVDADGDGNIINRETGYLITHTGRVTDQKHKLNYDNDGIVGWQGAFGQLEVTPVEDFNFFVAASASNTSYKRIDRFNYIVGTETEGDSIGSISDTYNFLGYNGKVGANWNFSKKSNVFFNTGYYSRAPIFDVVFPVFTNVANQNTVNEKVFAGEIGYGFRSKMVAANVNLYRSSWMDKTFTRRYVDSQGDDFSANIQGLTAVHQGLEIDATVKPVTGLSINGMISIGDWQWKNNVEAIISDDDNVVIDTVNVYAKGLKVGDAAQTTASLGANYTFPFGLRVSAIGNYAADLYASFDPASRTDAADEGVQAWELPSYWLLDLGLGYNVDFDRFGLSFNVNMNNVMDKLYVQEAFDNPGATGLEDLRGFFGFGRTWTAGIGVTFK